MSSCVVGYDLKSHPDYFETEYFMCTISSIDTIIIGGLTEKGSELEEVVFPNEIDGIKVTRLGYRSSNNYMASVNMKKVFIPSGLGLNRPDLFTASSSLEKVIFLSANPYFKCPSNRSLGNGDRYAPADYVERYKKVGFSMIIAANISYLNNYDTNINGGYHWIDDIEINEKIKTIPSEPAREGHIFLGWFKDAEGINQWDFDIDVKGEDAVVLYAKWIEDNNSE